jgi:uncharacterized membrane protein YkvA (DUF1232 family)
MDLCSAARGRIKKRLRNKQRVHDRDRLQIRLIAHNLLAKMTTEYSNFREAMTMELTKYIECQARALTRADLDRLVVDLPAVRDLNAKIPSGSYAYLADQIEFLCRFVEDNLIGQKSDTIDNAVAEAAFALSYFKRHADLIPDAIPHIGTLDDAMIVGMVLRRHAQTFRRSPHSCRLRRPDREFDVDDLLSVIAPLRLTSFCSMPGISERA